MFAFDSGLTLRIPSPPAGASEREDVITEEAGICAPDGHTPRARLLCEEDALVPQGGAVACLHDAPDIRFVAPIAGRVARSTLLPGKRLSEIVMFRERDGDKKRHDTAGSDSEAGLRALLQKAGAWLWLRRRPFGGMPEAGERPAAVCVMAADTRPLASNPRRALDGREEDLARGLAALAHLTDGPIYLVQHPGEPLVDLGLANGRVRVVDCGARHPQGSPGIRIHDMHPAELDAPVWDVHAEDVAAIGGLLETGELPVMRLVHVAGSALRESATIRTHTGADLRELTHRLVQPGAHVALSGSPLCGRPSHWLGPRDRQVSVLPREVTGRRPHWLVAALTRSARAVPVIPTAALTQAFGSSLPAAPFVRALTAGDDETAMRLGVLSLLEEDVALADYVLGGDARLADLLRTMLERIRTELAA